MTSLATLNASIDKAFATVRPRSQKRSPLNFSDTSFPGVDTSYGGDRESEQYERYRGRFYSAARVIVHRLASRPVFAARVGVEKRSRTLSRMVQKGHVPAPPEWIGNSDTLEVLTVHPVLEALGNPNPLLTQFNLWEMVGASLLATGRGFIVALPGENRPLDLYGVPATWMRPSKDRKTWRIKPPSATGEGIMVNDAQVVHVYFADPSNPAAAISPLTMMARAVLADEAISSAQFSEFKNPMPKVALLAGDVTGESDFSEDGTGSFKPIRLEPRQRRELITWFQQQYAGVQKYGLPIVLDQIIRDVKILSRKPAEMAFLESTNVTKDQIYEGLGVSRLLNGATESANRATAVVTDTFFIDNTLNPIITLVSQGLTKKLGPLFADEKEILKVWLAEAIPRDSELDVEYLRLGIRSYALQRNDVRDILRTRFGGLPRLEGMDDVVIPDKLEERVPEADLLSPGRLALGVADGNSDN